MPERGFIAAACMLLAAFFACVRFGSVFDKRAGRTAWEVLATWIHTGTLDPGEATTLLVPVVFLIAAIGAALLLPSRRG